MTGKIIDEHFYPVFDAAIYDVDTTLIAKADSDGNFRTDIPTETRALIIGGIGVEWKYIKLIPTCDHLEIVMLNSGTFDFISARKVDRLRKGQFEKLPELRQAAYDKGVFSAAKPCYEEEFIPIRKRLEEIHKTRITQPGA